MRARHRAAVGALVLASLAGAARAQGTPAALLHPDPAALRAPAPAVFRVAFETSRGRFVVEAHRAWAPRGVDRFYHLVRSGYYDGDRFFRVLDGFIAQFGLHGDPRVTEAWRALAIPDDRPAISNKRGTVSFAMAGPNTRTTQLFVNLRDNPQLDPMGFAPIGRVVQGMAVADSLYHDYGEGAPDGDGPDQELIGTRGNAYLGRDFPKLDYIRTARILPTTRDR